MEKEISITISSEPASTPLRLIDRILNCTEALGIKTEYKAPSGFYSRNGIRNAVETLESNYKEGTPLPNYDNLRATINVVQLHPNGSLNPSVVPVNNLPSLGITKMHMHGTVPPIKDVPFKNFPPLNFNGMLNGVLDGIIDKSMQEAKNTYGIPFETVKNAGFKRKDVKDEAYTKQTGHEYFFMTKRLMKGLMCEWSPLDQVATIYRIKNGEPVDNIEIDNELEFLTLINFLSK